MKRILILAMLAILVGLLLSGCAGLKPSQQVQANTIADNLDGLGDVLPDVVPEDEPARDALLELVDRMGDMADDLAGIDREVTDAE